MASFGMGEIFQIGSVSRFLGNSKLFFQAIAHGVTQGTLSEFLGGDFVSGASAAFFGSIAAGAAGNNPYAQLAAGAASGGVGSVLAGGNFWEGAVTGLIVAGFNHVAHLKEENSRAKTALRKLNLDPKAKPDFSKETVIDLTVRDENLNQMYKDADYPNISLDPEYKYPGKTDMDTGDITLGREAFTSYRHLYIGLGHELVHAYHYATGIFRNWVETFGIKRAKYNTELGAYTWNMIYDNPSLVLKWQQIFNREYSRYNK